MASDLEFDAMWRHDRDNGCMEDAIHYPDGGGVMTKMDKVTLTIEFTRYDGTEETLPHNYKYREAGALWGREASEAMAQQYMVYRHGQIWSESWSLIPDTYMEYMHFGPSKEYGKHTGWFWMSKDKGRGEGEERLEIGDLWAPWPVMDREVKS